MIKQVLDIGANGADPYGEHSEQACKWRGPAVPPDAPWLGAALAVPLITVCELIMCRPPMIKFVALCRLKRCKRWKMQSIAAIPGIDGVFIGPADLSADMGYKVTQRTRVIKTETAIATITATGKFAGIIDFSLISAATGATRALHFWVLVGIHQH